MYFNLLNSICSVRGRIIPYDLLVLEARVAHEPIQAIDIALGYPPELDECIPYYGRQQN